MGEIIATARDAVTWFYNNAAEGNCDRTRIQVHYTVYSQLSDGNAPLTRAKLAQIAFYLGRFLPLNRPMAHQRFASRNVYAAYNNDSGTDPGP